MVASTCRIRMNATQMVRLLPIICGILLIWTWTILKLQYSLLAGAHLAVAPTQNPDLAHAQSLKSAKNTAGETEEVLVLIDSLTQFGPFTLVLQPHVQGGTAHFSNSVLLADSVVVSPELQFPLITKYSVAPTSDNLTVTIGNRKIACASSALIAALRTCTFYKVFVNHPLGFSTRFLSDVFAMEKRFMTVTHDYVWVFDLLQPTFTNLRTPEGAARNYAFKKLLPKLEVKAQVQSTRDNFALFDHFKSIRVVKMPDYTASQPRSIVTSKGLVMGVIGEISWIKGLDLVVQLSNVASSGQSCQHFKVGSRYLQFGRWRLGETDVQHFSISHQGGQTPIVFRSDGSAHPGPRKDYNAWSISDCPNARLTAGKDFIQIGAWRMGPEGLKSFAFAKKSKNKHSSKAVVFKVGHSGWVTGKSDLWSRPVNTSIVLTRKEFLKIGSWLLTCTGDAFKLVQEEHGTVFSLHADGRVESPKDAHDSWFGPESQMQKPSPGRCHVKMFIFGEVADACNIGDNTKREKFGSIDEFNQLLERVRPNVMIIPALWPETYSYTLTLAMLTNLPIIVRRADNDFPAAIATRAASYSKTYFHDFRNITDVVRLAQQIRESHLTKIQPDLIVPRQWYNLLRPTFTNAVLVASKILTSSKPLWYHPQRSRFSAQERFNQTIETLKSIRLAIPDCFIVLIDNSPIDREQAMRLESLANAFVNDVNNQDLRYWTDESEAKQIGEAMLLQQGLDALEEHEVMYEQLFKLSGRYMLNHKFNLQTYNNTHNVFKLARVGKSLNLHKPFYAYTCFFNIYYEHIHAFRAVLSSMTAELKAMIARNMSTFLHDDVESRLSLMLPEVVYVEELGVTQRISTWDAEDKDI
ncbi:unnamed protein product [Effrenium voratum]|nr:unnamed protein product [Effrenium voratum]